ncbi:hypothetical protein AUC68_03680 [Methyloceanibacter methanicus]|uniref:Uncharacterized protein n=2 Tax=Methyloceanibacter methanicus TaxID=1774968 RepID=A0A1E3W0U8_9HYPH|nr:hypothetical protein AUC68_03680 [Methyloceanibacter methanicus]
MPIIEGNLAQICGNAADRVAQARQALHGDSPDPSLAMEHLDDAIACLKSLSGRDRAAGAEPRNTVVPFASNRTLHSA